MDKVTYLAVLEPSGSGYSAYFSDLPGCVSYGESVEAAVRNAEIALGLHLCGMKKDGDPLPAPSLTPQIDDEAVEGYFVSPISAFPD